MSAPQQIQVVSRSYPPQKAPVYTVLIDGRYYRINGETLDYLHEGKTIEWCGVEPLEEGE
jgi:hypothetical protein